MSKASEIKRLKTWVENAKTDFEEGHAQHALNEELTYWRLRDKKKAGKRLTKIEEAKYLALSNERTQQKYWKEVFGS